MITQNVFENHIQMKAIPEHMDVQISNTQSCCFLSGMYQE